jgi:hypothetical protein
MNSLKKESSYNSNGNENYASRCKTPSKDNTFNSVSGCPYSTNNPNILELASLVGDKVSPGNGSEYNMKQIGGYLYSKRQQPLKTYKNISSNKNAPMTSFFIQKT